jgi:hypothetical protein
MLWNQIGKKAVFALTGFVAGITLMLALGLAKDRQENEREILPKNVFGDLRIATMPVRRNEFNGQMVLYKGDRPIIYLFRNDANEVGAYCLTHGEDDILAAGWLSKSGLSYFSLYGNKVHDAQRTMILIMQASDKPGVWRFAGYGLTIPGDDRERFVGDVYVDLDVDGRFDGKQVFNDKSAVVSDSIFINGEWRELGHLDSKGQFVKRKGSFNKKDLTAFIEDMDSGKKTYFDFVPGQGWRERP